MSTEYEQLQEYADAILSLRKTLDAIFMDRTKRANEREDPKPNDMSMGVFAKTPDPLVFGPDRLVSRDPDYITSPYARYKECFYLGTYRRSHWIHLSTVPPLD